MAAFLMFLAWVLIILGVLGLILAAFPLADSRFRIAGPAGFVGPILLIVIGVGLLLIPIA